MSQYFQPRICNFHIFQHGAVQRIGGFFMGGGKDARAAQRLESAQSFGHHGFAESAPPVFGSNANQHSNRAAGVIIIEDGAERGDAAIRRGRNHIQIAAIQRRGLQIRVPRIIAIVI